MTVQVQKSIEEIIPDEHPHLLLGYFKEPFEHLGVQAAIINLHLRIATASDDELTKVADKITNYLVGKDDIKPARHSEISKRCLSEMLVIRDREFGRPGRQY